MRILKIDKQTVTIKLDEHKAQDLLNGLLEHPELGDIATELAQGLTAAGIHGAVSSDPLRYEYASPLHH